MKDNARQESGSTRSCGTPLPRFATRDRRLPRRSQNPYKIRTKSDHFRQCDFFNGFVSTTYNFNVLKCTDFEASDLPSAVETKPLAVHRTGLGKGEGQTGSSLPVSPRPRVTQARLLAARIHVSPGSTRRSCSRFNAYCTVKTE
jgi:hypothetical protein